MSRAADHMSRAADGMSRAATADNSPAVAPLTSSSRTWSWTLAGVSLAVAAAAVLLRLPQCTESLWVDELHSAWSVWGDWDQVAARAAAGNQTPWYFWMLWLWTQGVGNSEQLLRLPSVLAVAASCGVLVIAAARSSGRWMIGLLAGSLVAVDLNSIYFGTEARAYAFVMLFTTLAAWGGVELSRQQDSQLVRWRVLLGLGAFAAVLLHPTAGLSVAAMIAGLFVWSRWASRWTASTRPWSWITLASGAAVCLLALIVNGLVVQHVWTSRHHWLHFGVPQSAAEIWTMWPWLVAIVPLGLWAAVRIVNIRGVRSPSTKLPASDSLPVWTCLLPVVLVATLACWLLARDGAVPLWHRRYLIALLPLLWWGTADAWHAVITPLASRMRVRGGYEILAVLTTTGALAGLVFLQGTAQLWRFDEVVLRAEDWRGAVSWVKQHRQPGDAVFVGAELIESNELVDLDPTHRDYEAIRRYLLFPVSGPYKIESAQPLGLATQRMRADLNRLLPDLSKQPGESTVQWWIYRMGEADITALYEQANHPTLASPAVAYTEGITQSFGEVTVVRIETRQPK